MSDIFWVRAAGASMFLAVALGAFAAHGLKSALSEDMLKVFETGVRYQMAHALGLFAVAWLAFRFPSSRGVDWAGRFFLAGTLIFSGSLYALSLTGIRKFGALTPIGGLCFLLGWLCLVVGPYRAP